MKKRALLYMTDNSTAFEFAGKLSENGYEILSFGETYELLSLNGFGVISLEELAGDEKGPDGKAHLMSGSVVYGITTDRSDIEQINYIREQGIEPIDIVAVNLENFDELCKISAEGEKSLLSMIDIEKINFINLAAKNYEDVTVVIDKNDFSLVVSEIEKGGEVSLETRGVLAAKAISYTTHYLALLNEYFRGSLTSVLYPEYITRTYKRVSKLESGENAYQSAAFYSEQGFDEKVELFKNKNISYSSIADISFAYGIIKEIESPCAVAVKGEIVSGAAVGVDAYDACTKAFRAEGTNMGGGVLMMNCLIDRKTAHEIMKFPFELVVAPGADSDAESVLAEKEGLKLVLTGTNEVEKADPYIYKKVLGGLLVQNTDIKPLNVNELLYVTAKRPDENEESDLVFGFNIAKGSKSVSAVLVKDGQAVGIGQGQLDIEKAFKTACDTAGEKARGSVLATDSVIFSPELVNLLNESGITAIIQPGGALNTQDIIDICNENEISMMVTNTTQYKN